MLSQAQREQLQNCDITRRKMTVVLELEGVDEELWPRIECKVPTVNQQNEIIYNDVNQLWDIVTGWSNMYDPETGEEIEYTQEAIDSLPVTVVQSMAAEVCVAPMRKKK